MTAAAKSVYFFGFYLYLVGATLIFVPNIFLSTLRMPVTSEVWIRVLGVIVGLIGFYYHQTGAKNINAFFPLTIPTRIMVFTTFLVFVILKMASPVMVGIGAVDLAGAIWTFMALKKK
ncbi:MAG: hypothetical protein ACRC2O_17400 [Chitinophagaceae bacterium]